MLNPNYESIVILQRRISRRRVVEIIRGMIQDQSCLMFRVANGFHNLSVRLCVVEADSADMHILITSAMIIM